jgi:thiol-disulfide isomerase/thioredoxin
MAKYFNFNANSIPSLNTESSGILSRIMSSNTMIMIGCFVLFVAMAVFYYFYYIAPSMKPKYKPNSEKMSLESSNGKSAELLFFYADWCPHCKAAKPIWNDIKSEYENKTINGYTIVFTEVDCSEETTEVEKLMNQYNVEGYPTIKLVKDGQVIEYDAKPTKDSLTKFLNTVL